MGQHETGSAVYLDEGRKTQGVWLPLALAEIATELRVIIRMFSSKPEGVKVPRLSEYLSGWALPMMSAACKTDEEASDALAMMRAVERMANAQKGYK